MINTNTERSTNVHEDLSTEATTQSPSKVEPHTISSKLLVELACDERVLGAYVAQDRNVLNVHEDLSTEATTQSPSKVELYKKSNMLHHLAIIMDGNTRWARNNNMPDVAGYPYGVENIWNITNAAISIGIKHLSLFAFSYENWKRPSDEVEVILKLFGEYLINSIDKLQTLGIKLAVIGDLTMLDDELLHKIHNAVNTTKNNGTISVYLAFSYGGRNEIAHALSQIIAQPSSTTLNLDDIRQFLYAPDMPDVDLLIRTGNVQRISNFLLWQSAYAELYFSQKMWPDFDGNDLLIAYNDFKNRNRNFGIKHENFG